MLSKSQANLRKKILSSIKNLPDGTYQCKFCLKVFRCQHKCPELEKLLEKVE